MSTTKKTDRNDKTTDPRKTVDLPPHGARNADPLSDPHYPIADAPSFRRKRPTKTSIVLLSRSKSCA